MMVRVTEAERVGGRPFLLRSLCLPRSMVTVTVEGRTHPHWERVRSLRLGRLVPSVLNPTLEKQNPLPVAQGTLKDAR